MRVTFFLITAATRFLHPARPGRVTHGSVNDRLDFSAFAQTDKGAGGVWRLFEQSEYTEQIVASLEQRDLEGR